MALELTSGYHRVNWKISGYTNPFSTDYYICAGITTEPFESGTTKEPIGIVDKVYAEDGGEDKYSEGSFQYESGKETFYSFTQSTNGQYWDTGSDTVTITDNIPDISAYYTVSTTPFSIKFNVKNVEEAYTYWTYFKIFVYHDGTLIAESNWMARDSYFTWTASGLEPNTTYDISVYNATSSSGANYTKLQGDVIATTDEVPEISAYYTVSVAKDSITFNIKDVAESSSFWNYFKIFVYLDKSEVYSSSWLSRTSDFSQKVSKLSAGTTYDISVYVATDSKGSNATKIDGSSTATTIPQNITLWSWDVSNGVNCGDDDYLVQNAYDALYGYLPINYFSHKVWNDFVDKVMIMRSCVGDGTWDVVDGKYLEYDECHVNAGDTLSADIYNSVKVQIGSIKSTGISDVVSKKDKLTGYHIIHLTDVLNEIIESL